MAINIEYPQSILKSKLFNSLKDAEMKLLIKEAKLQTYKRGDIILKEGQEGDSFYWISSGSIVIEMAPTTETSSPMTLGTLGGGDVLGEMSLLGFTKRAASAIVKTESQVYAWNLKRCLDLFLDHPAIGYRVTRNLGHMIADKLIATNKELRKRSELLDSNLAKTVVSDY
jgi:CRP-like cAMP-binding protein